jgi:type III secretion system low calcium response chaperone LcrH/SycD
MSDDLARDGSLGGESGKLTPRQLGELKVLAAGKPLKDAAGFSTADVETIYTIGINYAERGRYEQAEPMFEFACLTEHINPRYWSALGSCRQRLKNYAGAIDAYGYAHLISGDDPWPAIHAAVCYLALADKGNAAKALNLAASKAAKDETARQRIAALQQAL